MVNCDSLWTDIAISGKEGIIVAHFGIVRDYKEVLPALIAKLKELRSA